MSADAVRVRPEDPALPGAQTLADELGRFPALAGLLAELPDDFAVVICLPVAGWIEVSRTEGNRFRFHPMTPEELVFSLLPAEAVDA